MCGNEKIRYVHISWSTRIWTRTSTSGASAPRR
jgi:hypothetical protein